MKTNQLDANESPTPANMVDTFVTLTRVLCLFVLLGLLIFGSYYAIYAFLQVGKVLADPSLAEQAVETISRMIDGEQLVIPVAENEKIPVGKFVSLLALFFGYLIWVWIPLKIVGIVGIVLIKNRLPSGSNTKKNSAKSS